MQEGDASHPVSPKPQQTSRVVNPWRRPVEADIVATRLTTLVHELSGLVDGSIRQVGLAIKASGPATTEPQKPAPTDTVVNRLFTLQAALERMADALRIASGAPTPWLQAETKATLADALRYATGIMQPGAEDRGIRLTCVVEESLEKMAPGHLYTVAVNAVRNGLEAVVAAGKARRGGFVHLHARVDPQQAGHVLIEVLDNGIGPPPLETQRSDEVFDVSFSTKPGGLGIGLALSRQIVESMHGTIELRKSPAGEGAMLVIRLPVPVEAKLTEGGPVVG
jgi:signal transduction histidine kinase